MMTSANQTIKEILNFEVGDWYSTDELKIKLQKAYDKVDFRVTAKASDVCAFYNAKRQQQREFGVQVNGYKILDNE